MYIVLQPSKTIGVYNLHCRCMPLLSKRFIYIAFGEKTIHIPQVNPFLSLQNNIFLKTYSSTELSHMIKFLFTTFASCKQTLRRLFTRCKSRKWKCQQWLLAKICSASFLGIPICQWQGYAPELDNSWMSSIYILGYFHLYGCN